MRKSFAIAIMLVCSTILFAGPKEVVLKFLEYQLNNDTKNMYELISTDDKQYKTYEDFHAEKYNDNPFFHFLKGDTSFTISSVAQEQEKAKVTAEVEMPNLMQIFMSIAMKNETKSEKKRNDLILKKLKDTNISKIPKHKTILDFSLVKEHGDWKIYEEWGEEAKEAQKEALAKIEKENKKKEYIKTSIKLYAIEAKRYDTYDGKVPGVNFKIQNIGKLTLKEVQVTVYFNDKNGSPIAEKIYHPVLYLEDSFSRDGTILKPNYIWQNEQGKFYSAKSIPSEWDEGNVKIEITNIEFMGQKD